MHLIEREEDLEEAVERSAREAQAYFGRPEVYLERYIARAHHVEAQILADSRGSYSFLGERDCSLQRRYQKLVEESPSPVVDADLRTRIGEAALAVAKEAGYVGAGTVEFLVEDDGSFYFLEVNARLQVEHPVTEMVTGLDLVRLQIAGGARRDGRHRPRTCAGHAIECRINAEDPGARLPAGPGPDHPPPGPLRPVRAGRRGHHRGARRSPGTTTRCSPSSSCGARIGSGPAGGCSARSSEFEVGGVPSTIPFHRWVLDELAFREGSHDTRWVERALDEGRFPSPPDMETPARPEAGEPATVVVEVDGRRVPVRVWGDASPPHRRPLREARTAPIAPVPGRSPRRCRGRSSRCWSRQGQEIEAGEVVCILEAMKMENHIAATLDGTVAEVAVVGGRRGRDRPGPGHHRVSHGRSRSPSVRVEVPVPRSP